MRVQYCVCEVLKMAGWTNQEPASRPEVWDLSPGRVEPGLAGDGVNIHTYTRLHPANQDIIREISEAERVSKYTGNNHSDKILSTELMDTSRWSHFTASHLLCDAVSWEGGWCPVPGPLESCQLCPIPGTDWAEDINHPDQPGLTAYLCPLLGSHRDICQEHFASQLILSINNEHELAGVNVRDVLWCPPPCTQLHHSPQRPLSRQMMLTHLIFSEGSHRRKQGREDIKRDCRRLIVFIPRYSQNKI